MILFRKKKTFDFGPYLCSELNKHDMFVVYLWVGCYLVVAGFLAETPEAEYGIEQELFLLHKKISPQGLTGWVSK